MGLDLLVLAGSAPDDHLGGLGGIELRDVFEGEVHPIHNGELGGRVDVRVGLGVGGDVLPECGGDGR